MNYQCVGVCASMLWCGHGGHEPCMNSSVFVHMPPCKCVLVHEGHQPLHEVQGTNSGLSGLHCKDLHPLSHHLSSPDKLKF